MIATREKLLRRKTQSHPVACHPSQPRPALQLEVRREIISPTHEEDLRRLACFQRYATLRRRLAALTLWREEALRRPELWQC